jgi:uncharacterized membrane protein
LNELFTFLHSWTRWLLLIVGILALVYFVMRRSQARDFNAFSARLLNAFGTLIVVQWLFGLVLFIVRWNSQGSPTGYQWSHLGAMTIAMLVANAHHGWRRRQLTPSARYLRGLIVLVVSFALLIVGILLLPSPIQWRFYPPSL